MTRPELEAARSPVEPGLRGLAERFRLPGPAVEKLRGLLTLLAGDPLAPTAIREPQRVLDDHLADSLVALELEELRGASTLVDLGAGAGLPGIPLAIARPELAVTLLESSGRKCAFLERATAALRIGNVDVIHTRAESWPGGLRRFDVATARALASLEVVLEYAAPLLVVGGTLVAWRGMREAVVEAAAAKAAGVIGMEPGRVVPVKPYEGSRNRNLHLISKVMETPFGFPRRAGVAQKRPLSELPPNAERSSDRRRR